MKQIKVKNEIGYVSLVGILEKEHPLSFGNYFSLGGFHVLNMWYENFKHLNINKSLIDAVQFGDSHIVIVDKSIPDGYLNDEPCFTGGPGLSVDNYKELYDFMFPRYKDLKCLCCDSAKYVSVRKEIGRSAKAGLSLWEGKCRICNRHVYLNQNKEVDDKLWEELNKIYNKAPSEAGLVYVNWSIETLKPEITGLENYDPKLLSRYAEKSVNSKYYSYIRAEDRKDKNE